MSSAGRLVGGVVGAVVGFYMGNPMLGYSIGSSIGGMIDPPKTPEQHLTGPRLTDLTVQTSTYGQAIPRSYGMIAMKGNIIWLENNSIKENVTISSDTQGGKGGGGGQTTTTTSYSYSATFALALCEGVVDGISRIWVGHKLIFDKSSTASASALAQSDLLISSGRLVFYSGSDTQNADPRMQATLGVESTPAYRGICYLVFNDFQLKDYGNSLMGAQVKVELMKDATLSKTLTAVNNPSFGVYAYKPLIHQNYMYLPFMTTIGMVSNNNILVIIDISNPHYPIKVKSLNNGMTYGGLANPVISGDYLYFTDSDYTTIHAYHIANYAGASLANPVFFKKYNFAINMGSTLCVSNGFLFWSFNNVIYKANLGLLLGVNGGFGGILSSTTATSQISFPNFSNVLVDGLYTFWNSIYGVYIYDVNLTQINIIKCFCKISIIKGNYIYIVEETSVKIYNISNILNITLEFTLNLTCHSIEICDNDLILGVITSTNFLHIYDITNNVLPIFKMSTHVDILFTTPISLMYLNSYKEYIFACGAQSFGADYLSIFKINNIANSIVVPIQTIITEEVKKSNLLTVADLNVTTLSDTCRGYVISNIAPIRTSFDPLQGAFPFDVIQDGYIINCKKRGGVSIETINWTLLDARSDGQQEGVQLTSTREMDLILPKRVAIKHLDVNREYDYSEQYAERMNTDAINIKRMDLPLAMTPSECAGVAEMLLYMYWLERYDVSFKLPSIYNHLQPTDIITINTSSNSYELRITNINYTSDGRLECSARYNKSSVYNKVAVAEVTLSASQLLLLNGPTTSELLDIPSITEASSFPGFAVVMHGNTDGWSGGSLFSSSDSGLSWKSIFETTPAGSGTIGAVSEVLSVKTIDECGLIDASKKLTATMVSGTLSSVTEIQMLNGKNYFAYGSHGRWEIIAVKNCVLVSAGVYTLSDFLRGRNGTEWATGLHVAGDKIIELSSITTSFINQSINTIGLNRTYRPVTIGDVFTSGVDQSFTYLGVNLRPISPIKLNGDIDSSQNFNLSWIHRTRVGVELRDYVDVMLSEDSERYDVEIYSDNTYTLVKDTLSVTTSSAQYTISQQIASFGVAQSTLYVKIYQVSAIIGRGYALKSSITR